MIKHATEDVLGMERLFRFGTIAGMTDPELLDQFIAGDQQEASTAFEALVLRYGPMVRHVCRTRLRDPHMVDDAFQATFLVLAKKARSLRHRELLSGWLYGVASRTARKAKAIAARRREIEHRVAAERSSWVVSHAVERSIEVDDALHEEIDRLPSSYRSAIVLCYFDRLTHHQAARRLRLPESTVRGRLARARKLLEKRLSRRGITSTAVVHLLNSPSWIVAERVPPALTITTVQVVTGSVHAGQVAMGALSHTVHAIADGVLLSMSIPSLKAATYALIACAVVVGGAVAIPRGSVEARLQSTRPVPPRSDTAAPPKPDVVADGASNGRPNDSGQMPRQSVPSVTPPVNVTPELARIVSAPIVRAIPLAKDCMVLSYLPDWAHGDVDNIGIGNNDGGVRTLLDWPEIPHQEAEAADRRFVIALYARQTIARPPVGRIHAFAITDHWPERTSWKSKPAYDPEPVASFDFVPGSGWKLFDITPIIRRHANGERRGRGAMLRFLNEDFTTRATETFSDYKLVSREAAGEWADRRPLLLIVKSVKGGVTGS